MKQKSFAARLRVAQERALVAERALTAANNVISRIKGDWSDTEIVGDFTLGESADTAIRTARRLGFVVTVVSGRSNSEKFSLRAHRPE